MALFKKKIATASSEEVNQRSQARKTSKERRKPVVKLAKAAVKSKEKRRARSLFFALLDVKILRVLLATCACGLVLTQGLLARTQSHSKRLVMRRFLVPKATDSTSGSTSEPPTKKLKPETAVEVSSAVSIEAQRHGPKRYLDNLLSPIEQANAAALPSNAWVDLPPVLLKLRSDASRIYSGILALDMDSTVIKTRSGKTFATNKDDWQFWSDKVVPTLRHYHDDLNFAIALVSNQGGVAKGRQNAQELKDKVDKIIDATEVRRLVVTTQLNQTAHSCMHLHLSCLLFNLCTHFLLELQLPIDFICCQSASASLYRKPLPGMWFLLDAARWHRWRCGRGEHEGMEVPGLYVG